MIIDAYNPSSSIVSGTDDFEPQPRAAPAPRHTITLVAVLALMVGTFGYAARRTCRDAVGRTSAPASCPPSLLLHPHPNRRIDYNIYDATNAPGRPR